MAYINGKKVLFSANVNIQDIDVVEVVKSGYEISQTINDDDTCDLVIIQDDGSSSLVTVKEKEITENGKYDAREDGAVGYSIVNVNVPIYNLSIEPYDASIGGYIANQSQKCLAGQQIILYAEPTTGYQFDGWYDGLDGGLISTSMLYSYTMPNGDAIILAKMSKKSSSVL